MLVLDRAHARDLHGQRRRRHAALAARHRARLGQRRVRDAARLDRPSGSSATPRAAGPDGRSIEIQRLIGRSLRAIVDLEALGERTVWVDCDVLQADGGTRCASICGGYVALHRALSALVDAGKLAELPLTAGVAAISCGIVEGEAVLDLDYQEDSSAEVDLNVVMTSGGRLVEVQGTAEGQPFDRAQLDRLLELGALGHGARIEAAAAAGGRRPPMSRLRAVLATGNSGKAAELSRLLGSSGRARPIEVEENAGSYAGNALLKARAARAAPTAAIGLGDDSGIEVAALGGEPGLRSARWAGPTDADRNAALLARLDGRRRSLRRVRVRARRGAARRARDRRRGARRRRHRRRAARRGRASATTRSSCRRATRARSPSSPAEKDALSHRARASRALVAALAEAGAREPGRRCSCVRRGAAAGRPPRRRRARAARARSGARPRARPRRRRLPRAASAARCAACGGAGRALRERDRPIALAGEGCATVGCRETKDPNWRSAIHLKLDTARPVPRWQSQTPGAEVAAAGTRDRPQNELHAGSGTATDALNHGTMVRRN